MSSYEGAEALRRRYLPPKVRVLFVGESPPAGGTFFYAADSGLYRATRDAFYQAVPELRDGDFLENFAALGCYLDDLCHEPIDSYERLKRAQARRANEVRLGATIRELQPGVVIILLKSIVPNVDRAISAAGIADVERHVLTYPSRWHRHRMAYRDELCSLLRHFVERGILRSDRTLRE
jgi:hypothetical protein